jgi:hypothetical protein
MRLLCPNCAKELQVPDQYAGQMMKCPLCSGTFTVPALPSMPGAVSMPAPPPPPPMAPPPQMQAAPAAAAPPPPAYAPPPAAVGQPQTVSISPALIHWLAPVCLVGMLISLFFPWVGMFPNNVSAVTQTGWQAAFGGRTPDPRWQSYSTREKLWERYYGDNIEPLLDPGSSLTLIFFILLLVLALVLALLATLVSTGTLKINIPPALAGVWPYRSIILAGLTSGCLALLVLTLWSDFPLETTAHGHVKAQIDTLRANPAMPTPERDDTQRWDMELGIRLGGFALRSTAWVSLAVILNVVAVLGALLQARMDRAGAAALPTIQLRR